MKPGPKESYCYICQHEIFQCGYWCPCQKLTGKEKRDAYRVGYQLRHRDDLKIKARQKYELTHPNAGKYKTGGMIVKRPLSPERAERIGRAKADKEADRRTP